MKLGTLLHEQWTIRKHEEEGEEVFSLSVGLKERKDGRNAY